MSAQPAPTTAAASPPAAAPLRVITVHLTPWAIGCAHLPVSDRRRWKEFWSREPIAVLRTTLRRLGLRPAEVSFELQVNGDIALQGPAVEHLIEGDPAPVDRPPLALIYGAISLADLTAAAAARLRRDGWTPNPDNGDVH